MSKNKFIKVLKIICVIGPLVFNLIACVVGSFSASNLFNDDSVTTSTPNDLISSYEKVTEDFINIVNTTCFRPYFIFAITNEYSSVPIVYTIANFISEMAVGNDIEELSSVIISQPNLASIFGLLCFIAYYLFIEFIFFIPEVIILFIRWCKNLIYAFTQKGGFDA